MWSADVRYDELLLSTTPHSGRWSECFCSMPSCYGRPPSKRRDNPQPCLQTVA